MKLDSDKPEVVDRAKLRLISDCELHSLACLPFQISGRYERRTEGSKKMRQAILPLHPELFNKVSFISGPPDHVAKACGKILNSFRLSGLIYSVVPH